MLVSPTTQRAFPDRHECANVHVETVRRSCDAPGQPCAKVKRAAEAIAAALAEPAAVPEPEAEAAHHFCYRIGEPCSKHKRALEELAEKVNTLV